MGICFDTVQEAAVCIPPRPNRKSNGFSPYSNHILTRPILFIDTTRDCFEGADAIQSAEEICDKCYTEIGNDVLLENDREYELWQMHQLERDEFLRRVQQYDAQLPEYHYLIEQLLSPPAQAK